MEGGDRYLAGRTVTDVPEERTMKACMILAVVLLAVCGGGCSDGPSDAPPGASASPGTPAVQEPTAGGKIEKERAEVPAPSPVARAGVRYQAVPWGKARGLDQNGGYLAAVDEKTGAEQWILKVYHITYDGDMEGDKQDVFITKLALEPDGHSLRVENERGEAYRVDLETRRVAGPL
jgi:hypothetical protein